MLVNPDIEEWFNKLAGKRLGGGGSAPRGMPQNYAAAAAEGIVKPGSGMFDFRAPAIEGKYQPRPQQPYSGGPRELSPQSVPFQAMSGGGGDLGGAAKAAGLQKLGQGISEGLQKWKANKDAHEVLNNYTPLPALDGPLSRQMAQNPGATMPNLPQTSPYSPPPIGDAGGTPIIAQGDVGRGPVPPIGGGGSLPTFAAAAPSGAQAAQPDARLLNYIYGEAGNQGPQGQQAVANVLSNRAAENFRGYGTTMEAQATKGTGVFGSNSEFNGYRVPPQSAVPGLQNALDNAGKDITGGARFFANPSASSAGWARNLTPDNSLKIGDHYFTDNTNGTPFSGGSAAAHPDTATAQTGAGAYASTPPSLSGPGASSLAGPPPTPNSGGPPLISPGQPQTGPAYSDETWNNRPQYDYGGGGQAPVPMPPPRPPDTPGQQGMNDQTNPLAAALMGGDPHASQIDPSMLAMALSQPDFGGGGGFDFGGGGDFGGGFGGGLFG